MKKQNNKLTKEEFIEKYGDVLVEFDYYYKYLFHFKAKYNENKTIYIDVGGNSDDIYRCEVVNNEVCKVKDIESRIENINYAIVKENKTGNVLDYYSS